MVSKPATPEKSKPAATAKPAQRATSAHRTVRETVESIVVAFVLAFLFRTFEAEAFVIPTGSMAPTLQGRHKDVVCPECKFPFRVGASSEESDRVQSLRAQRGVTPSAADRSRLQDAIENEDVVAGICPNCRDVIDLNAQSAEGRNWPSYNGDRILVAKFPYDFADPERWDVIVFRFPGDAKMNYIKRLVGLPNQSLRIFHGDIYVRPEGTEEFAIEHKPPDKVRAMAQTVYNNDFVVDEMTTAGWPLRWAPAAGAPPEAGWQSPDGGRSYRIQAGEQPEWLRYTHFIPSGEDWMQIENHALQGTPKPHLITDFYAYDSYRLRGQPHWNPLLGVHWVGDLLVEAEVNSESAAGAVTLELVRGGRHFQCVFDLATGQAQLGIDGLADFHPQAHTAVRGTGKHRLMMANVDRRLLVWVDGSLVTFDADTAYPDLNNAIPNADDLAPAGIAVQGATVAVEHLVLKRDVYYIADNRGGSDFINDYDFPKGDVWSYEQFRQFFSEPDRWSNTSLFSYRRQLTWDLKADQFFVLGDNSPYSKDSRLWASDDVDHREYYVKRELLIGKALFIYWPHSFNRLPGLDIPFPFFPNFKDMGFVR